MDFINLNFEVRNKNLNSDDKKELKNKKDIPTQGDTQPKLAKPSSELLKAYSNIVSFRGESSDNFDFLTLKTMPNYKSYATMFKMFNSLKNGAMGNTLFKALFADYTVEEIATLFDEVIANQQEEVFAKLVNGGKKYPESDRNIGFKEAKELIDKSLTERQKVQQYLELRPNADENKIADVELQGTTDTIGVAKLLIEKSINKNLYEGVKYLTDDDLVRLSSLNRVEIEKELKRQINVNSVLAEDESHSDIEERKFRSYLTDSQLIRYEKLIQDETLERPLEKKEALACVLLGLSSSNNDGVNQIQQFIGIRTKNTDLNAFEVAHLVKLGVDPEDENRVIDAYIALKSQPEITFKDENNEDKTYTLLPQESLLCAKENLTPEQLKRFAEFRTTTTEVNVVRQHNKQVKLSPQLIINYIKANKSDSDIETELRLYTILEQGIDVNNATIIAKSDDLTTMLSETDASGNKIYTSETIVDYAKKGLTTRTQIDTFNVVKQIFDEFTAIKYAQVGTVENIEKCKELIANGVATDNAITLANDEEAYDRYQNLLNSQTQINLKEVVELVALGFDEFEQLERYNTLKEDRPEIDPKILVPIAKHSEYAKLREMLRLKNANNTPLFSCSPSLFVKEMEENPDVSTEEFIKRVQELYAQREDLSAKLIVKFANHSEYSKLLEIAKMRDRNENPLFYEKELDSFVDPIGTNGNVGIEEFKNRFKKLRGQKAHIPSNHIVKVCNHSEYTKLLELEKLKHKDKSFYQADVLMSVWAETIGTNPDVSDEEFIRRVQELNQKRPDIPIRVLVTLCNHSEYSKFLELANVKDKNQKLVYSSNDFSFITKTIGTNPEVSDEEFVRRVQELNQKRRDIPIKVLVTLCNHSEYDKLLELASKKNEKKVPVFSDADLFCISKGIGKNPDVSIEEFIKRVQELKQKRPDITPSTLIEISNHSKYTKILESVDLKDEKDELVFSVDDLDVMKAMGTNPDVTDEEFIRRAQEISQKGLDIDTKTFAELLNHDKYTELIDTLKLEDYSSDEIPYIIGIIGTNSEVSYEECLTRFGELSNRRQGLFFDARSLICNHSKYYQILELVDLKDENTKPVFSSNDLSSIARIFGSNPLVTDEEFIQRIKGLKQRNLDISSDTLAKISNNNEYENIINLIEQGVEPDIALSVYSDEKYLKLLNTSKKLSPSQAVFLALNTSISSLDPKMLEKLGSETLYKLTTGTDEKIFATLASAMLKLHTNQDLISSKMTDKDIDLGNIPERDDCSFDNQTADFEYTGTNGFKVNLEKVFIGDEQVIVIKNNQNAEKYVAYDGAITLVKQPLYVTKVGEEYKVDEEKTQKLKDSLKSHSNISSRQTEILAEAIRHFIVKVADDDGNCIISDGLTLPSGKVVEPFNASELSDADTKQKYSAILDELGNNVTMEDILKLMPKDSILQINPFVTSEDAKTQLLFSISSEWQSKDGTWWQMRVHSQDLGHVDNPKEWIYRLGYTQGSESYFYKPKYPQPNEQLPTNSEFDSTGSFLKGMNHDITHVLTKVEDDESFHNKLISNYNFQNIFRNISCTFNERNKENYIAEQLGITVQDKEEMINEILKKCYENIENYFRFKEEIDRMLATKGLSFFGV